MPFQSDTLLKAVFDNATDCIFIKDTSLSYTLVNRAMCELFQMELSDIIGKTDAELFGVEAAAHIAESDERVIRGGTVRETGEKPVTGEIRTFDTVKVPVRDAEGNITGLCGIARDITDRKQSERAFLDKTREFETFFSCSLDLMCIADLNGCFRRLNPEWERTLGYPLTELEGRQFIDFVHPDDREATEAALATLGTGEAVLLFTNRYRCRDGSYRCIEWRSLPVGELIFAAARDITESRKAEEEIRSRERLLQKIFDTLPIGLWFADKDGRLLTGNPAGVRIWGAEPRVGLSDYGVFKAWRLPSREYVEPAEWALAHTVREGVTILDELLLIEAFDGSMKTILNSTAPVTDDNDTVQGAIVVNQDITDRMRVEEALRASEEKYRLIAENTADVITVLDMDLNFTYVSPSIERLRGYTPDEAMKQTLDQVITPESLAQIRGLFHEELGREAGHGSDSSRFRTLIIEEYCRGGGTIMAEVSCSFLRDENGKPAGILTVSRDISDRIRAEAEKESLQQQLVQSQKMESVGRLAGGVAHDFNNMLGVIIGYAEMAAAGLDAKDPLQKNLGEIIRAARHSAELTGQLLAFARRQEVSPRVLDLNRLVDGTLNILRRLVGEDIDLVWNPGASLWNVRIDPTQVDQILTNLTANARDAISGVGSLAISTSNVTVTVRSDSLPGLLPGEYVLLTVSDDGCGIDPDQMDHLFEPFFTTKEMGKGTGLGLATVYGIVKQNLGYIYVDSSCGKGTTVTVYLPRNLAGSSGQGEPERCASPVHGSETILFVEDEDSILDLGTVILEQCGYRVLKAKNPSDALALLKRLKTKVDLLISDVVMPGMNGRDLRKLIEVRVPGIKVLYISGYTSDILAGQGIVDDSLFFLQKPFSPKAFTEKVRLVLDSSP